jgi:phytoene dehydrogenase-like protein
MNTSSSPGAAAAAHSIIDVVVIGGGLAGLTTAALLSRAGKSVTLFEQSSTEIGGRARTAIFDGFYFNQGPHALYLSDIGAQVLQDLGITYTGGNIQYTGGGAATTTAFAIKQGNAYPLPSTAKGVLTSKLLGLTSKLEFGRIFSSIGGSKKEKNKIDSAEIEKMTVREWLEKNIRHSDVRDIVRAFLRLNTYANDPDIQSAGSALHQLSSAVSGGGIMYLDRGWQTLVDGLVKAATNANAKITTGKKIVKIEKSRNSGWIVIISDRTQISAKNVIIATSPKDAYNLCDDKDYGQSPEVLSKAAKELRPVRMACLDVALSSLPNKDMLFALGIDIPVYFSVHSAYAKLTPEKRGAALIHVAKYLGTSVESRPMEDQQELESLLDMLQPGWREVLVKKRPLPNMIVTNGLVTAAMGGLSGRPKPRVLEGLYIAGDWVGPEGLLSNASFASARQAAQLITSKS